MPREEIDAFIKQIPDGFCDPLTGFPPRSERELSAIIATKHQFKQLQWPKVPLWQGIAQNPTESASVIISDDDYVFAEYPLFAKTKQDIDRWGSMAPDLLFLSADGRRITLVECKLDSHFTHGDNPPNGQLSRYLEYLGGIPRKALHLLLICPKCNHEWYAKRLANASEGVAPPSVTSFVTRWENIFDATQR